MPGPTATFAVRVPVVVVLKPLSKALADGDPIYAVIRGSAVNQDGRSNGLMAPNPLAQEAVLREAYRRAGVSPGHVQYVEAHGTGTFLGDPIEAKALGAVLAVDRPPGTALRPGLGQDQHRPPRGRGRHRRLDQGGAGAQASGDPAEPALSRSPTPIFLLSELPLRVQTTLGPWPTEPGPALAGVSSFGFGGTNAHVVLEEAPRFSNPECRNARSGKSAIRSPQYQVRILAATFGTQSGSPSISGSRISGLPCDPGVRRRRCATSVTRPVCGAVTTTTVSP